LESCTILGRCSRRLITAFCLIALMAPSSLVAQELEESTQQKPRGKTKKDGQKEDGAKEGSETKSPKHPSWTFGPVKLDFKARLETELRTPTPATGLDRGQIDWQDRRLGFEGTAFKRVTFEVSRELSQDFEAAHDLSEKTPWKDAYASVRFTKAFNIQAGRFKLPFGREELTSEPSLDFAHRSLAARVLSPGRDVGVMAHGRFFGRTVNYQAGYFTRDGDNGRTSQTKGGQNAVAGRLVLMPFASTPASALAPFEIGMNASESRIDDRLGLRGRTVLGDGVIFDRVYVNGTRRRAGLDAAWTNGPIGLTSEYIVVSDERKGMGFGGNDLPNIVAAAWYVAGTWAVTGERKHGRLDPSHSLLRGGFGAIELKARVESLRFRTAVYPGALAPAKLFGNTDRATTVGVNWYLNHYLKLQGDVVLESVDDPERSPAPTTGGRFTSTVVLLQFRF
jgi:phosphate-selective porin OprO/OprP